MKRPHKAFTRKEHKYIGKLLMVKSWIISLMVLILLGTPSIAQNDIQERLKKAEREFWSMSARDSIQYRMLSELYIKRFGMKKYDDLIWREDSKCFNCGKEK